MGDLPLRYSVGSCSTPAGLQEVSRRACLSFPTSTSGTRLLIHLGIARELTGKRRNRVFGYDRYLKILSEGTEPL